MPLDVRFTLLMTLFYFARAVQILVLIRVIMSWFPVRYSRETDWFYRARDVVWRLTEPFLEPIRRLLPFGNMGIDFSPLVLLLLLDIVYRFLVGLLLR